MEIHQCNKCGIVVQKQKQIMGTNFLNSFCSSCGTKFDKDSKYKNVILQDSSNKGKLCNPSEDHTNTKESCLVIQFTCGCTICTGNCWSALCISHWPPTNNDWLISGDEANLFCPSMYKHPF